MFEPVALCSVAAIVSASFLAHAPFLTAAYAGGLPSGAVTLLPAVLMVAVFYLLLFRPNQRKQKQWQEMLNGLKIGDKITTTGGMRGTIVALREDAIQLKLPPDGVKVEIVKSAIAAVTTNTPEEAK